MRHTTRRAVAAVLTALAAGTTLLTAAPAGAAVYVARNCGGPVGILAGVNNRWAAAELGGSDTNPNWGMLRVRTIGTPGPWERFQICEVESGGIAIKSLANGRFVAAEVSRTGTSFGLLRARTAATVTSNGDQLIGPWEVFAQQSIQDRVGFVSFAATDRGPQWVTTEVGWTGGAYAIMRAARDVDGPWEMFDIVPLD